MTGMWILFAVVLAAEWRSVAAAGWIRHDFDGMMELSIGLGTPPQGPFTFSFSPLLSTYDTTVAIITDKNFHNGLFNPNASSTFEYLGRSSQVIVGSDVFEFDGGIKREQIELDLWHTNYINGGLMSLRKGDKRGKSFIDRILEKLNSKSIVLRIIESNGIKHKGSVILGEPNPEECAKDWTVFSAQPYGYVQETFNIDQVTIGSYHHTVAIHAAFDLGGIFFDRRTQAIAENQLGVASNGQIDCNQTIPIEIRAGNLKWIIGPKEYIRKKTFGHGVCEFTITGGQSDLVLLPIGLLSGNCLRYDYTMDTIAMSAMK